MSGDEQLQQQNPSADQPRKKRAKIVSACSECRRKKTKCNGEQPCRSCEKSHVPCIYPSAAAAAQSQAVEDRRGRAQLEAVEDRLKTIEDMLRVILQSMNSTDTHHPLDQMAITQFLNGSNNHQHYSNASHSSSPSLSPRSPPLPPSLPYHHQRGGGPPPPPPPLAPPPPPSSLEYRLPSIHLLESEMPPFHVYRPTPAGRTSTDAADDVSAFQPVGKRKR